MQKASDITHWYPVPGDSCFFSGVIPMIRFYFILRPTLLVTFKLFNHVDLIFLSSLKPIYEVQISVIMEMVIFKMYLFFETPGQVTRFHLALG